MADLSNLARARAFREAVGLTLQLAGLEEATAAPIPGRRRVSEAFADDAPRSPDSHIQGVPGWALGVHADVRSGGARWGTHLDAAEQVANLTGAQHFGVVGYRRERPTSESFVVLTLNGLARLILAAESSSPS